MDRLAETLRDFGLRNALVGIDGEMRGSVCGLTERHGRSRWRRRRPGGARPIPSSRLRTPPWRPRAIIVIGSRCRDAAYCTRWTRGAALIAPPASVTVIARTSAEADAWATARMVLGPDKGAELARRHGLDALFLLRSDAGDVRGIGVGGLFGEDSAAVT